MRKKYVRKRKYKRRRRYRKKSYRRRGRRNRGTTRQASAGIAESQIVRLKYAESYQANPSIGLVLDYVFSANGIYDPNITGTGHQPMCFDQWMNFYDHYAVIGSKITVCITPTGGTVDEGSGYIAIYLRDTSTTMNAVNFDSLVEQPRTTYRTFGGYFGATNQTKISKTFSCKKFFRKSPLSDYDLAGTITTNPNEQAYFHVIVSPLSGASDLSNYYIRVMIQYIVVFTEPVFIAGS